METKMFSGETVVVSGAAGGIGLAAAKGFAAHGCRVVVADRNGAALDDVRQSLADPANWFFKELDITNRADCAELAQESEARFGPASVLINNAGVSTRSVFEDDNFFEEVERLMAINVGGTLNLTHAYLDQLKAKKGSIVNVASIVSLVAGFATIPYGASKGAVAQMTRSLARDLSKHGIRVNAIAPAFTNSPLTATLSKDPARISKTVERTFLKRVAEPEDMVGPILFLASHMAAFVTGTILPVDGGYTAA